ncbi:aldehyde dehydrogenase family protein, partial [Roseateles sp. P5_E11]
MERIENYVNGRTARTRTSRYFDKYDPRTGQQSALVACSDPEDVQGAAESCAAAFDAWNSMRPTERGRRLVELARVIRRHEKLLGDIESAETGKPGREMPVLIDLVAQFFEYYGGLANAFDGEYINVGPAYHAYVRREALGVVGIILPWNAPLHQA